MGIGALVSLAIAKDSIIEILVGSQRNASYNRGGNDGDKQQGEGSQEKDGEGGRGFEEHG